MYKRQIKFYYEQVKGGKRQYYGGSTRAKEYKSLPEVLSKNEIKRILAQIANIKHCLLYTSMPRVFPRIPRKPALRPGLECRSGDGNHRSGTV